MAAYAIFIRNSVSDADGLAEYAIKGRAARGDHRLEPLVFYGPCDTVEGTPADGVVILKFENMEAARAWYTSDAYQAAAKIRQRSADYRVILADGI